MKNGTPLSKSQVGLSVEIWISISDDPRYFNKRRSTMSDLLCSHAFLYKKQWKVGRGLGMRLELKANLVLFYLSQKQLKLIHV